MTHCMYLIAIYTGQTASVQPADFCFCIFHLYIYQYKITYHNQYEISVFLNCLRNGCSPMLAATWVISSHTGRRADQKLCARARMNQRRWILDNIQDQCEHWYYFDLFRQEYVNFVGEIVSEM